MVEEAYARAQADPDWLRSVVDRALAPLPPGRQPPASHSEEQGALMLDMHLRAEARPRPARQRRQAEGASAEHGERIARGDGEQNK